MSLAVFRSSWRAMPRRQQVGAAVIAYLACGLYVVGPDQVAVVRIFGEPSGGAVASGVWWRPPWPMGKVNKVRVNQPRQVGVGASVAANLAQAAQSGAEHLTGDQNLVRLTANVQYTVSDPALYLFEAAEVDNLVAATVQSCLTEIIAETGVDELMTTGQAEVTRLTVEATQRTLDEYGVGVRLVSASAGAVNLLQEVKPPPEVAQAFSDVSSAKQDYERKVNEAHGYANELLPQARGEASEMISQAEGYAVRQVNEAKGRAARFRELAAEYRRAPQVTRIRLQMETIDTIGPRLNATVVDSSNGQRPIDLGVIGAPPPPPAGSKP